MKEFNVEAVCIPSMHYMVDISDKLEQIQKLIEKGKYFTINRSRQYGKTTTLAALFRKLKEDYIILRLSFEGAGSDAFQSDKNFVMYFIRSVAKALKFAGQSAEMIEKWKNKADYEEGDYVDAFDYLSDKIAWLCENSEKDILLFIDEVDKTSDNQIFLNFLGMLRNKYMKRQEGMDDTFKSVILAGVYDIKNLKLKLRPEEEKKYNSPWNIAADFNVDMSFSPKEIATMLEDYEADHHTGMDIGEISNALHFYTNGYPYLVSWLCKWIDEQGGKIWTIEQVKKAQRELLKQRNTLFDDIIKNLANNHELSMLIKRIIYDGDRISYTLANDNVQLGVMFGILTEHEGSIAVSNIIFEVYLYNYFSSMEEVKNENISVNKSQFIIEGKLDMPHILTKFQEIMKAEYRTEDGKFLEQQGRLLFLCFLKPIINGTGFYYVEPETRNNTRMDIVVTYGKEEHIIELKLWHGDQYRKDGIQQLEGYLDSRNNETGYLVSFSFNQYKEYTSGWIAEEETGKHIFEIVI